MLAKCLINQEEKDRIISQALSEKGILEELPVKEIEKSIIMPDKA